MLGHVAPGLTFQLENLAPESLLYILRRYGEAREAFVYLASTVGYAGPKDLTFDTQVRMQHGNIPDLVDGTTNGARVLLAESSPAPLCWLTSSRSSGTCHLPRTLRSCGGSRVVLGMLGVALFAAFTELPQKRCHELQSQPSQNRGHACGEQHDRRKRINKPRCHFIQSAHSATPNVEGLVSFIIA